MAGKSKAGVVRRRINGPTARDSLAQPNGLGLNVDESSGPTVRDPDQFHTYRHYRGPSGRKTLLFTTTQGTARLG